MKHPSPQIFDMTLEELQAWCVERGMAKFRAAQVMEWVYEKGVADPGAMSNLSKLDRETLTRHMTFLSGLIVRRQSATDGVEKLLIEWDDSGKSETARQRGSEAVRREASTTLNVLGAGVGDPSRQTECVMIPTEDRRTACISSQIGCPVGCKFCASGLGGLDGNLSAGRIVEQVWLLQKLMRDEEAAAAPSAAGAPARKPPRISNVVFMGMGEPLANFAAVTRAIRIMNSAWGFNISARKVTISTVGLPQAIERLAIEFDLPVTLALSLHAPSDDIRRELIPWASYTTIKDLLASCQKWFEKTGREITLEYTLLRGVNDRPGHAAELAALAKSLRANVNLIRYNEVEGLPFKRPLDDDVREFQELLRARGVNVHIRASRGRDIKAACGQLRHETAGKESASKPGERAGASSTPSGARA
ncbi:MAG: 23S rRNA (adenine(2503)-C(2))-methyltransferase RlmN [Phycisphaerae bacterium]|nr:23S rRNA (adenine(2503)-C(2))-methyltransferase RlmN [Phycisphaerae bacterium]